MLCYETRVIVLKIAQSVWTKHRNTKHQNATDRGRTDRRTDRSAVAITAICFASNADALKYK